MTTTPFLFSSPFASTPLIWRLSVTLLRNYAEKLSPSTNTNTKTNPKGGKIVEKYLIGVLIETDGVFFYIYLFKMAFMVDFRHAAGCI